MNWGTEYWYTNCFQRKKTESLIKINTWFTTLLGILTVFVIRQKKAVKGTYFPRFYELLSDITRWTVCARFNRTVCAIHRCKHHFIATRAIKCIFICRIENTHFMNVSFVARPLNNFIWKRYSGQQTYLYKRFQNNIEPRYIWNSIRNRISLA